MPKYNTSFKSFFPSASALNFLWGTHISERFRIFYIGWILPVLFITSICACSRNVNETSLPNVVIIFIDDMGYGDPSCYGNQIVNTPNIDKLAEMGTRFTNFYVNSPICSPSRVALNTGRYPMRYAIHSYIASSQQNKARAMADFLDPSAVTMAKIFKANGYATGHFGKWHMGGGRDLGNVPYPTEYGFDKSLVSFEGIGDRVLFPNDNLCSQSAQLGKGRIIWAPKSRSTSIYVDSALAFVERNLDSPFYLHLFPNDVHDPHLPDSSLLYDYKSITSNPWEQKFYAVLAELDRQIGRFITGLKELGELDNTIIIFTSDNGPTDWPFYYNRDSYPENYSGLLYPPGSTGGFYGRKWSLYEGGIRMPFFISWKGHIAEGGTNNKSVISAIDIFPSLVSLIGLDYSGDFDGIDKSEAFLGKRLTYNEPVFWEYASNPGGSILPGNPDFISPNLAVRVGAWKLLINSDSTGVRLFNLEEDPSEQYNLSEKNSDLASQMAAQVLQWRRSMPVKLRDVP